MWAWRAQSAVFVCAHIVVNISLSLCKAEREDPRLATLKICDFRGHAWGKWWLSMDFSTLTARHRTSMMEGIVMWSFRNSWQHLCWLLHTKRKAIPTLLTGGEEKAEVGLLWSYEFLSLWNTAIFEKWNLQDRRLQLSCQRKVGKKICIINIPVDLESPSEFQMYSIFWYLP